MEKKSAVKHPKMSWLKRNFIAGLLVLVPITGTIFLFVWVFSRITDKGLTFLLHWKYFEELYRFNKLPYDIIGRLIILFSIIAVIILTGFLTRNFIGNRILRLMEKLFDRLPFFNRIFQALKQISKVIMNTEKPVFSYAVLFEFPRKGIYSIGFVMSESFPEAEAILGKEVLNVFFVTTPNPTNGFALTVPKEDTIRLSMSVEEAFRLIISAGSVVPEYKKDELAKGGI